MTWTWGSSILGPPVRGQHFGHGMPQNDTILAPPGQDSRDTSLPSRGSKTSAATESGSSARYARRMVLESLGLWESGTLRQRWSDVKNWGLWTCLFLGSTGSLSKHNATWHCLAGSKQNRTRSWGTSRCHWKKECGKNMHELVDVERVAKKLSRKEKVDPALAQSVALLHHNQDEYCIVPAKQRSRRGRRWMARLSP